MKIQKDMNQAIKEVKEMQRDVKLEIFFLLLMSLLMAYFVVGFFLLLILYIFKKNIISSN